MVTAKETKLKQKKYRESNVSISDLARIIDTIDSYINYHSRVYPNRYNISIPLAALFNSTHSLVYLGDEVDMVHKEERIYYLQLLKNYLEELGYDVFYSFNKDDDVLRFREQRGELNKDKMYNTINIDWGNA